MDIESVNGQQVSSNSQPQRNSLFSQKDMIETVTRFSNFIQWEMSSKKIAQNTQMEELNQLDAQGLCITERRQEDMYEKMADTSSDAPLRFSEAKVKTTEIICMIGNQHSFQGNYKSIPLRKLREYYIQLRKIRIP